MSVTTVSVKSRANADMLAALKSVEAESPEQTMMDVAVIFAMVMHAISDNPEEDATTVMTAAMEYVGGS